jgi:hypothetical protein
MGFYRMNLGGIITQNIEVRLFFSLLFAIDGECKKFSKKTIRKLILRNNTEMIDLPKAVVLLFLLLRQNGLSLLFSILTNRHYPSSTISDRERNNKAYLFNVGGRLDDDVNA